MTPVEQVLDLARWAPSGDNTQPWRFDITGERTRRLTLEANGPRSRELLGYLNATAP